MPAIYLKTLKPRSQDSGRLVSIVFAIIASIVIAGCLIWGLYLPKFRKSRASRSISSPTTFHDRAETPSSRSDHHFPSHPALLREFRQKSYNHIRQYDPRFESPFTNAPPSGESVNLPSISLRYTPSPSVVQKHDRHPTKPGWLITRTYRKEVRNSVQSLVAKLENHSSDKYNLTVPKPLHLRAKPAGRAPPLTRQLEKFPLPYSKLTVTESTLLLKTSMDLQQKNSNTGFSVVNTSTTSLNDMSCVDLKSNIEEDVHMVNSKDLGQSKKKPDLKTVGAFSGDSFYTGKWTGDFGISITKPQHPTKVIRAGTVTRPKTPVAEMRAFYDQKEDPGLLKRPSSSSQGTTTSTQIQKIDITPSASQAYTPPTSPLLPPSISASQPLNLACDQYKLGYQAPTSDAVVNIHDASSSKLDFPPKVQRNYIAQVNEPMNYKSRKVRPPRLNLVHTNTASANTRVKRSISSLGSFLTPAIASKRPSVPASSIYSRDTKGISIAQSPASPFFRSSNTDRVERTLCHSPFHPRASSMVLLQRKIDNWNLYLDEIDLSTLDTPALKRTMSDIGPRSPVSLNALSQPSPSVTASTSIFGNTRFVLPQICIGRSSDDIFRDTSTLAGDKSNVQCELNIDGPNWEAKSKTKAPGGAEWI